MTGLLYARWRRLPLEQRRALDGLTLCIALFLFHYTWFSFWYVEDAAISFSFARNLANGEGLVAFPGGERVEGFSNPTWTLLLAAMYAMGINPWIAAKLLGAALGVICLPLAMAWTRRLVPDRPLFPVLAPLLLAISPYFVQWCAAGLENPLFDALLVAAAVALLREIDAPGRVVPWSGVLLAGLAATRPEGPLYAGVAASVATATLAARRGLTGLRLWLPGFVPMFVGPLVAWHLWRYLYFAWEFPNTYYAKLSEFEKFLPLNWERRGWQYLRGWALASGQGFLFPLYILGLTGFRGRRLRIGLALSTVLVLVLLPGVGWLHGLPGWPFGAAQTWLTPIWEAVAQPVAGVITSLVPESLYAAWLDDLGKWPFVGGRGGDLGWMVAVRGIALIAVPAVACLVGLGRRGQGARALALALLGTVVFFAHYSGGDWMSGHRWLGLAVVPLVVLLADAAANLSDRMRGWRGQAGWLVPTLVCLGTGIAVTAQEIGGSETSPYDVRRRVLYMQGVARRLALDQPSLLEVDMGAHMWWSGFELFDMAGLIDVPIGHHKPHVMRDPFMAEYVFDEHHPTFGHVHNNWANRTKIPTQPAWIEGYLEIPPYPTTPRSHHGGNHVRKDLFVQPDWRGPQGREVPFAGGPILRGWEAPATTVAEGGTLFLEVGWQRGDGYPLDFRPVVFLSGPGQLRSHELPPGYDWYTVSKWRRDEVIVGRHHLDLAGLPPGTYDLGVAVLAARVLPGTPPPGATADDPVFARGEVRWPGTIRIVPRDEAVALANTRVDEVVTDAEADRCDAARERWRLARRHLDRDDRWHLTADPSVHGAVARCLARRALSHDDVDDIREARALAHRDATVLELGTVLADRWQARGVEALDAGELDEAHHWLTDTMFADPTRSWVRRQVEELRDRRLFPDRDGTLPEPTDE